MLLKSHFVLSAIFLCSPKSLPLLSALFSSPPSSAASTLPPSPPLASASPGSPPTDTHRVSALQTAPPNRSRPAPSPPIHTRCRPPSSPYPCNGNARCDSSAIACAHPDKASPDAPPRSLGPNSASDSAKKSPQARWPLPPHQPYCKPLHFPAAVSRLFCPPFPPPPAIFHSSPRDTAPDPRSAKNQKNAPGPSETPSPTPRSAPAPPPAAHT